MPPLVLFLSKEDSAYGLKTCLDLAMYPSIANLSWAEILYCKKSYISIRSLKNHLQLLIQKIELHLILFLINSLLLNFTVGYFEIETFLLKYSSILQYLMLIFALRNVHVICILPVQFFLFTFQMCKVFPWPFCV